MARFVPAHQHAFMSLLVFVMFAAFVGYIVWHAVQPSADAHVDAGP